MPRYQKIGMWCDDHQPLGIGRDIGFQIEQRIHVATGQKPTKISVALIVLHQANRSVSGRRVRHFRTDNRGDILLLAMF